MFGLAYEKEIVEESDTDVYDSKAWSETEISEIRRFEHVLSKEGFAATLYLPTKSSKVDMHALVYSYIFAHILIYFRIQVPKEQGAVIKKKKRSDRVECEVKVDDKPKLFRFLISEVDDVSSGKGLSNVVPASVEENRCMNFLIKGILESNIYLLTHLLTCLFTHSCVCLISRSFIYSLIYSLTQR